MKDRIPTQTLENGAIRYGIYNADGSLNRYEYIKLEDEPTEEGTPLNKANLLSDTTAQELGFSEEDNPSVDMAIDKLQESQKEIRDILENETAKINYKIKTKKTIKTKTLTAYGVSYYDIYKPSIAAADGKGNFYLAGGRVSSDLSQATTAKIHKYSKDGVHSMAEDLFTGRVSANVATDGKGNVLIIGGSYYNSSGSLVSTKKVEVYRMDGTHVELEEPFGSISGGVATDADGNVIVFTGKNNPIEQYSPDGVHGYSSLGTLKLAGVSNVDKNNNIWYASSSGTVQKQLADGTVSTLDNLSVARSITSIIDNNGNFWVGTNQTVSSSPSSTAITAAKAVDSYRSSGVKSTKTALSANKYKAKLAAIWDSYVILLGGQTAYGTSTDNYSSTIIGYVINDSAPKTITLSSDDVAIAGALVRVAQSKDGTTIVVPPNKTAPILIYSEYELPALIGAKYKFKGDTVEQTATSATIKVPNINTNTGYVKLTNTETVEI